MRFCRQRLSDLERFHEGGLKIKIEGQPIGLTVFRDRRERTVFDYLVAFIEERLGTELDEEGVSALRKHTKVITYVAHSPGAHAGYLRVELDYLFWSSSQQVLAKA